MSCLHLTHRLSDDLRILVGPDRLLAKVPAPALRAGDPLVQAEDVADQAAEWHAVSGLLSHVGDVSVQDLLASALFLGRTGAKINRQRQSMARGSASSSGDILS